MIVRYTNVYDSLHWVTTSSLARLNANVGFNYDGPAQRVQQILLSRGSEALRVRVTSAVVELILLWFFASFYYVFECLPGVAFGLIGSLLVKRIQSASIRVVLYSGFAALAVAPGASGHLVRFPAVWSIFAVPENRAQYVWSIVITWCAFVLGTEAVRLVRRFSKKISRLTGR